MDTNPKANADPSHNPDVQEALSRRYAPEALTLLRLRSGNIALFAGMPRDLITIISATESVASIFQHTPPPKRRPVVDLSELGLI
jgi:hypothetical protein